MNIFSLLTPRMLWRLARGMFVALTNKKAAGCPLAVCWFVNLACNAKCHFCCKAREIRQGNDRFPQLGLDDAKKLLAKIRNTVDLIYISGGEPLIHPHILEILIEARRLGFSSVGMSSNLINLDKCPKVLDYLDAISVSIHAPDAASHAKILNVSTKTAQRVFDNLEIIKNHPRREKMMALINCVVTKDNLPAATELVSFAKKHGFLLEVVPANDKGTLPKDLAGNPEYVAFIDMLLDQRKSGQGAHLAGSTDYYKRIRDFKPFRCFPYGVPNIMPNGRLCTPCDISGQYAVNVLEYPTLKKAVRASLSDLGDYPCKKGYCFKSGVIERSRLFGMFANKT